MQVGKEKNNYNITTNDQQLEDAISFKYRGFTNDSQRGKGLEIKRKIKSVTTLCCSPKYTFIVERSDRR